MTQPKRHGSTDFYRYGFQGQEKDDEVKGENNSSNYKYRMHDPRVGRFFAVDPLTSKYSHYTPYSFSGNRVIDAIELEGLEEWILNIDKPSFETFHKFIHVVQHDDILNEILIKNLNRPELEKNHKIRFGIIDDEFNNGKTLKNKHIRGYIRSAMLYNKNKDYYKGDDFEQDALRTIAVLEAIGITSDQYQGIIENKEVKIYAVLLNSKNGQSEKDNFKTVAHELILHLENEIMFQITGDEKYNKSMEEEHEIGYGPGGTTDKDETPPDSKMGKIFEKIDKAYDTEEKKEKKED